MLHSVRVELFIAKPMRNEKAIRTLLGVFRSFPRLALTHWSPEDKRSLPAFDEETAVRGVLNDKFSAALAIFKRKKKPSFEGNLTVSNDELNNVSLTSQYYRRLLAPNGIACNMSRRADCWDTTAMENLFASLKKELAHETDFATRAEARAALIEYIEASTTGNGVTPHWGTSPRPSSSTRDNN